MQELEDPFSHPRQLALSARTTTGVFGPHHGRTRLRPSREAACHILGRQLLHRGIGIQLDTLWSRSCFGSMAHIKRTEGEMESLCVRHARLKAATASSVPNIMKGLDRLTRTSGSLKSVGKQDFKRVTVTEPSKMSFIWYLWPNEADQGGTGNKWEGPQTVIVQAGNC